MIILLPPAIIVRDIIILSIFNIICVLLMDDYNIDGILSAMYAKIVVKGSIICLLARRGWCLVTG